MESNSIQEHLWAGQSVNLALKRALSTSLTPRPGFVWLGGFRSDMEGTKALALVDEAARLGCGSLRFDYSGHGESGGAFEEGTISRWVDESLAVFRAHTQGPQVLVGSSMGAWISLRLVQRLQQLGEGDRIAGLLLIAPAPDFTATLMEPGFTAAQRQEMEQTDRIEEPSEYSDEPMVITRALIEDGRDNLVLTGDLHIGQKVRILQGMQDPDVPYEHALSLVENLPHDDVQMTLVRDGDHRLSRDGDIALLRRTMGQMVG